MQNQTEPAVTAAGIAEAVGQLRTYDFGKPTGALLAVDRLIGATYGKPELRAGLELELARLLDGGISLAVKQFICQKLWTIGTGTSLPATGRLLGSADGRAVEAACYALSNNRSREAGRALRHALSLARGSGLVAVINALGDRRDPEAATRLAQLAAVADPALGGAAIAALGKIATPEAIRSLEKLHAGERHHEAASHALLEGGQLLAAKGHTAAARQVLQKLAGSRIPQVQRGAGALVAALGNSPTRPKSTNKG